MAEPKILPIEFLRECFSYDPDTGAFRWKHRPSHHFQTEEHADNWNRQYAGTAAFATCDEGGYCRAEVRVEGQRYRLTAGRVAYALVHGEQPRIVDHRGLDKSNNRIDNLRAATQPQNVWNRPQPKRGAAPLKGAYLDRGRWTSRASVGGRKVYLGQFDTPEAAHAAYCAFLAPIRGEFFHSGALT